jgi:Flp pilus assembly protein TadG
MCNRRTQLAPRTQRTQRAQRNQCAQRTRRDSGALTLTYVIIVPVFLLIIMIIVQAAMWFLARSAALAAARQGVDAARVQPVSTAAGVAAADSFASRAAPGYLLNPQASATNSSAVTIVISVTGNVPSLVPGLPIRVTQVAAAPVERFTAP